MCEGQPGGRRLTYRDTCRGLCEAARLKEIAAQGWSLNPGRYVGATPVEEVGNEGFEEQFEILTEGLDSLNAQALELQTRIAQNVASRLS